MKSFLMLSKQQTKLMRNYKNQKKQERLVLEMRRTNRANLNYAQKKKAASEDEAISDSESTKKSKKRALSQHNTPEKDAEPKKKKKSAAEQIGFKRKRRTPSAKQKTQETTSRKGDDEEQQRSEDQKAKEKASIEPRRKHAHNEEPKATRGRKRKRESSPQDHAAEPPQKKKVSRTHSAEQVAEQKKPPIAEPFIDILGLPFRGGDPSTHHLYNPPVMTDFVKNEKDNKESESPGQLSNFQREMLEAAIAEYQSSTRKLVQDMIVRHHAEMLVTMEQTVTQLVGDHHKYLQQSIKKELIAQKSQVEATLRKRDKAIKSYYIRKTGELDGSYSKRTSSNNNKKKV
eukprot:TRINITY_DN5316_c0_g1_i2.p1 TRINITY_DN5316_c0_g1~~TRINITY_DN5316_c0_g1_i2.p1  ORF type:complete len:344 (+),score=92.09 TRINITY_DN5316_c0_g1_i2:252-1283(+)